MERDQSWEKVTRSGSFLKISLKELAKSHDIDINIFGIDALCSFRIDHEDAIKFKTFITQEMLKLGFLASTSCYLSLAHNKDILDSYMEALEKPFSIIARFLGAPRFN